METKTFYDYSDKKNTMKICQLTRQVQIIKTSLH